MLSHPKNAVFTAKIGCLITLFECDFEISQPLVKIGRWLKSLDLPHYLRSAVAVRCECAGVSRLHFNLLIYRLGQIGSFFNNATLQWLYK